MKKAAASDFLPTGPSANTATPRSLPRSPINEPAGSPNSSTAATGSVPSSPIATAARSGFIPTTPTRAAGVHSSNVFGTLVGYVHNISPTIQ